MTSGGMAGELGAVHVSVIPSLAGAAGVLREAARQHADQYGREFSEVTAAMAPAIVAPLAQRMESELTSTLGPILRRSLESSIASIAPGGMAGALITKLGMDKIGEALGLHGGRSAKNYVDEFEKNFKDIVPVTETHMNAAAEKAAAASARFGKAVEGGLATMLPAMGATRAAWKEFAEAHAANAEEAATRGAAAFEKSQAAARALAQTTQAMGGQMLSGFKNMFPEVAAELEQGMGKLGLVAKAGIAGAVIGGFLAVGEAAKKEVDAIVQLGHDAATQFSSAFTDVIHGKLPDIVAAFGSIESAAKTAFLGPLESMSNVILPLKGLTEPIKAAFGVFDTFKDSVGPVVEGIVSIGDAYLGLSRTLAESTTDVEKIEGLTGAVRDIMATGAVVHFEDVANSIGRLNANIQGLDTTQLKELTTTFAEAEELVGHIDEEKFAGIVNAWNIPAHEANETLTMLVNTARATGIQFNLLADEMVRVGPAMRDLGYDAEDTASFFALMTQQGEKGTRLIFGMNEAVDKLNTLVGKGLFKDVKSGYEEMITAVQKAESTIGGERGHALALEVLKQYFTPSTAPLMLEMIEKGIVKIGKAGIEIQNLHQDLGEAVEKTKDLGQTMEVIGQQISAALAPVGFSLAKALQEAGNHVTEWLRDNQTKMAHWGAEVVAIFGQVVLTAAITFNRMLGYAGHFFDAMVAGFRAVANAALDIATPLAKVADFFTGGHVGAELDKVHDSLNKLGQVHVGDFFDKTGRSLGHLAQDTFPKVIGGINDFVAGFERADKVGKAFEETINGKVQPAVQGLANPGGVGMGGTAENPLLKLTGSAEQQWDVINKLKQQGINLDTSSTGVVQSVTYGGNGVSADDAKQNWEEWFKENVTDVMGKTPTVLNVKPHAQGQDISDDPSKMFTTNEGTPIKIPVTPDVQSSSGPSTITVPGHKFGGPTGDPMVKGAWEPGKDNQLAVLEVGEYVVPRWMVPGWGPALEAARRSGSSTPHGDTRSPMPGGHAGGGNIAFELEVQKGFMKGLMAGVGINLPKDKDKDSQDYTGYTAPSAGAHAPGSTVASASNLVTPGGPAGDVKQRAYQGVLAAGGSQADFAAIDYIFQNESSWKTSNPNLRDSNAIAGNPSDGLGQLTGTNRRQYARPGADPNSNDAYDQAYAAVKYMQSRYGSIQGAYQYWLGHHNYAGGGLAGYAEGGMAGGGLMSHSPAAWYSGSAKSVSTASTADLNKHFARLAGGGIAGYDGGGGVKPPPGPGEGTWQTMDPYRAGLYDALMQEAQPILGPFGQHLSGRAGGGQICGLCGGGHPTGYCTGGKVHGYGEGGDVGGVSQVIWSDLEDPSVQASHGDAGIGVLYGKIASGGPGSPYSDETNPNGQGFAGHHGHVHTTFNRNPFNLSEKYGIADQNTTLGDYSAFPPWVKRLGDMYGLDPKTYTGHQVFKSDGLNHGIDWYPRGKQDMSGKSYTHQDNVTLTSFATSAMAVGTGQGTFGGVAPAGFGSPGSSGSGSPGGGGGPYSSLPGMAPTNVTPYAPATVGPSGPMPATGPNPWSNMPPGLTADQQADWTAKAEDWQRRTQDNATKLQQQQSKLAEAQAQAPALQQQLDAANQTYQQHLGALRQMWGQDKTEEQLQDLDKTFHDEAEAVKRLVQKLDPLNKTLSDLPSQIQDTTIQGQSLARDFPKPPKEGDDKAGETMGQQLGQGLVKGLFQELGFPDVFGKPFTQWGIWKLLMGGLGFGAGVLEKKMEGGNQMPSYFPGTGALPGPSQPQSQAASGPAPTPVTPDTGTPVSPGTTMNRDDALKGIPGYPGHYTDQQYQAILGADQKGVPPTPAYGKPGGKWTQDANKNWFYQNPPDGGPSAPAAPGGGAAAAAPPRDVAPDIFSGPAFSGQNAAPPPGGPSKWKTPGGDVHWDGKRWRYDDGSIGPDPSQYGNVPSGPRQAAPQPPAPPPAPAKPPTPPPPGPAAAGLGPGPQKGKQPPGTKWIDGVGYVGETSGEIYDPDGHPTGKTYGSGQGGPTAGGDPNDMFNAALSSLNSGTGGAGDLMSGGMPGMGQVLGALPHMLVGMQAKASQGYVPSQPFQQGSRGGATLAGMTISRASDIPAGMAAGRGPQVGGAPGGGPGGPNINYNITQTGIMKPEHATQPIMQKASRDSGWFGYGAQMMAGTG